MRVRSLCVSLLLALHVALVPAQNFYETVGVIKDLFTAGVNFAGDATGLFGECRC